MIDPDNLLLAYVGPETALPLASILAVVVGFLLALGPRVRSFGKKLWEILTAEKRSLPSKPGDVKGLDNSPAAADGRH